MAVTYVDRYLSRQNASVRKSELQLIGVSALFFAAKLEEIYPPKLAEFAYVTDSACTEVEMREMELMMLKVSPAGLGSLNPNTVQVHQMMRVHSQATHTHNAHLPHYKLVNFRNCNGN